MTYVALGNATMQNGKACWTVGDLTGSLTLSLTAKVDADAPAGSLTNNATATSDNAGRAKANATINVPARHGVKGKLKRTARRRRRHRIALLHRLRGERTGRCAPRSTTPVPSGPWPAEPTSP